MEYALWYVFPQVSLSSLLNIISHGGGFFEVMSIVMGFAGIASPAAGGAADRSPRRRAKPTPAERFAAAYDLTGREPEVLEQVIAGRT